MYYIVRYNIHLSEAQVKQILVKALKNQTSTLHSGKKQQPKIQLWILSGQLSEQR